MSLIQKKVQNTCENVFKELNFLFELFDFEMFIFFPFAHMWLDLVACVFVENDLGRRCV